MMRRSESLVDEWNAEQQTIARMQFFLNLLLHIFKRRDPGQLVFGSRLAL